MTRFLLRRDCRRADNPVPVQQTSFSAWSHSLSVFLKTCIGVCSVAVVLSSAFAAQQDSNVRVRARDMGIAPGILAPGTNNAITDVAGVRVGHATIYEGDRFRTGVTAILPHNGNVFRSKVPAAIVVGNGFGKLAGLSQVQELGTLETPVLLTGTLSVPRVADALISYMLGLPGNEDVRSINPVVGETNDGRLSDIRARPIQPDHVYAAIRSATTGPVREGVVGAGTGTVAFGFKGGIGTSSRIVGETSENWTVGVLVQTNFGARRSLLINGAPVGARLEEEASRQDTSSGDGSCMIIVATDAPLQHRGLERLGLRALMGMARTGSNFSNGSGDYVIAFSTNTSLRSGPDAGTRQAVRTLPTEDMSPLFQAVIEATEEAIYNSLFMAESVSGFGGRRVEALPLERVREILMEYGALR